MPHILGRHHNPQTVIHFNHAWPQLSKSEADPKEVLGPVAVTQYIVRKNEHWKWSNKKPKGLMGEGQWWEFKYRQYSFALRQGFWLEWHNCWSQWAVIRDIKLAELFYHAEVRNQKVKRWKKYCGIMTQICYGFYSHLWGCSLAET